MRKRKPAPKRKKQEQAKKPRRKGFWLRAGLAALLFFGAVYIRDNVEGAQEYLERCLTESVNIEKFLEYKGL